MTIPFTQYLRPHGIATAQEFSTTPDQAEVEAAAHRLIAAGYRFEAEHLATFEVSLTVAAKIDGEWHDIAIEVVPNGPEVVTAVERLVASATAFMEEQAE